MPIGAINLRNSQTTVSMNQNFGKKVRIDNSDDLKNRKAAGIAISVGLTAVSLVALYAFRGKISELPLFKNTKGFIADLMKNMGGLKEKAQSMASGIGEKTARLGENLKTAKKTVDAKAKELGGKAKKMTGEAGAVAKDLGRKTKKIAEDFATKATEIGTSTKEVAENVSKKTLETVRTIFRKK